MSCDELEPLQSDLESQSSRATAVSHARLLFSVIAVALGTAGLVVLSSWRSGSWQPAQVGNLERTSGLFPVVGCVTTPMPCPDVAAPGGCTTTPNPCPDTLPATLPPRPDTLPATLPPKPDTLPATVSPGGGDAPNSDETMETKEPWALTWAYAEDEVEVYYLMSPLMMEQFKYTMSFFGLYHSGVGFKNKRTGMESLVQFYAKKLGPNILIPDIHQDTHTMTWDQSSKVYFQEGKFDTSYWTEIQLKATITGSQYNEYIKWAPSLQERYTNYYLFNLEPHGQQVEQAHMPEAPGSNGVPGSVTCMDVSSEVFRKLAEIAGAENFAGQTIKVDEAYLWTKKGTEPRKLDMTHGSADYELAFHYFETLSNLVDSVEQSLRQGDDLKTMVTSVLDIHKTSDLDYAVLYDAHGDYWYYTPSPAVGGYRVAQAPIP